VTVAFGPAIDFGPGLGDDADADHARITTTLHQRVAELVQAHGGLPAHRRGDR
jgi:hypothetical protein